MNESEAARKDILNRLSRLEGQVRGVMRMLDCENPDCEKIVGQLSAVHSALESATKLVVVHFLRECLEQSRDSEGGEEDALKRVAGLLINTRF